MYPVNARNNSAILGALETVRFLLDLQESKSACVSTSSSKFTQLRGDCGDLCEQFSRRCDEDTKVYHGIIETCARGDFTGSGLKRVESLVSHTTDDCLVQVARKFQKVVALEQSFENVY